MHLPANNIESSPGCKGVQLDVGKDLHLLQVVPPLHHRGLHLHLGVGSTKMKILRMKALSEPLTKKYHMKMLRTIRIIIFSTPGCPSSPPPPTGPPSSPWTAPSR